MEDIACASPVKRKPMVFRLNENGVGPDVVRTVLLDRGWEEFVEGENEEHDWNLWWRTNRFRMCDYDELMPWQRLNHFPKTTGITKKDTLARNMRRMRGVYGVAVYNFTPVGFNLPNDYTKFVAEYSKSQQEEEEGGKKEFWICKPADLSRGRGIFIFQDLSDLTYDCTAVAQKYITNPCLIGGYKFDLRIYVLVKNFQPLTIYMYQEGIVRFSTEKFDLSSLGNMFSHLTNTSINKLGPSYTTFKEGVGPGCKWSLTMLRNYFHQQGIDDQVLWQRICNIVTLTMLAQAPTVPKTVGCVELFGFDILIDENLKPWLLEVNFSPALGLDCPIDHTIKKALINDILDLMHFNDGDEERGGEQFAKLKQKQAYSNNRRGNVGGVKRGPPKQGLRRKPSITSTNPSRLSMTGAKGARGSIATGASKGKVMSNDKLGIRKKGPVQGTPSRRVSQKQSTDSEDDYDEEIAAVCKRASSEIDIKGDSQQLPSQQSNIVRSSSHSVKPGSGLNSLVLPSVEESRKQLESRRELIRSRHEQKQNTSSPLRKPSVNSQVSASASNLNTSRNGTLSKVSGSISHSQLTPTSRNSRGTVAASRLSNQRLGAESVHRNVTNNSRSTTGTQNVPLKRTPSLTKPVLTRTGLKPKTKDGPSSIMNEKGANNKAKNRESVYAAVVKSKAPVLPPQRVGDFVLTFPFNDATRRASYPSLDIRTIIRETQKLLRRTICKAHSTKRLTQAATRAATQRAAGVAVKHQFEEGVIQWAPLKSQTLLTGQC